MMQDFDPHYLKIQHQDDAVVASMAVPRLTEEINLEEFGRELFAIVEQYGCRKLVVSLRGVEYLTSSAIGKLITLHRKMHRLQGHVVFCEIQQTASEILRASRLHTYFTMADNLDAALGALPKA